MTRKDVGMLMAVLQSAFPAYYRGVSDRDALAAVNIWSEMFADDNTQEVLAAVKLLIATQTEGYPPTIGAVKAKLAEIRDPERMTPQAAWSLVSKAAAGNLKWDKLPPLVQKVIGSPEVLREWGLVDMGTFNTVIYSQFVKAYAIYEKREMEMNVLPQTVRNLILGMSEKMAFLPTDSKSDGK